MEEESLHWSSVFSSEAFYTTKDINLVSWIQKKAMRMIKGLEPPPLSGQTERIEVVHLEKRGLQVFQYLKKACREDNEGTI